MSSDARLQAQINELRQRLSELESSQGQLARHAPITFPREVLARSIAVAGPAGGFDRVYTAQEQDDAGPAAGDIGKDQDFKHLGVLQTDRDVPIQSYSMDMALMEFGQHKVITPSPHRLIPVRDAGAGGSFAGGRTGRYCDVASGSISPFRAARPIMFAQLGAQFVDAASLPTKTGNVYPGFQCWPLPGSPLPGVVERDGFFICFIQAPGDKIADLVISDSVLVNDGDTVTVEVTLERDAQGNVLGASIDVSK